MNRVVVRPDHLTVKGNPQNSDELSLVRSVEERLHFLDKSQHIGLDEQTFLVRSVRFAHGKNTFGILKINRPAGIEFHEHEGLPVHGGNRRTEHLHDLDVSEHFISPFWLEHDELNRHVLSLASEGKPEHTSQRIIGVSPLVCRSKISGERIRFECTKDNGKINVLSSPRNTPSRYGEAADQRIGMKQALLSRLFEACNDLI